MSTRRTRPVEVVNAFLASLFLMALGLAAGLIVGIGETGRSIQKQADAGYLSLDGRAYRVTPLIFTEGER